MNQAKILIVEDEIGIANFMTQGLQEENLTTSHCMSGEDALLKINQEQFDVILLDWMILNLSGLEVCKAIRNSDNPNKKTPIIFITAKDTVDDTIEGLNAGANDYIKKPFDFNELVARINVYLRQNQKDELPAPVGYHPPSVEYPDWRPPVAACHPSRQPQRQKHRSSVMDYV